MVHFLPKSALQFAIFLFTENIEGALDTLCRFCRSESEAWGRVSGQPSLTRALVKGPLCPAVALRRVGKGAIYHSPKWKHSLNTNVFFSLCLITERKSEKEMSKQRSSGLERAATLQFNRLLWGSGRFVKRLWHKSSSGVERSWP